MENHRVHKVEEAPTFIHIGGDGRSGGSLIARLLDHPPGILSFPLEHELFIDRNERLTPLMDLYRSNNIEAILEHQVVAKLMKFASGKLVSKQLYDDEELHLDELRLTRDLRLDFEDRNRFKSGEDLFYNLFRRFFQAFHYQGKPLCFVNHCSRTFLADLNGFFEVFTNGIFVHTIREPLSFIASFRNYTKITVGVVKPLQPQWINLAIDRWILNLWHALRNKQKYGQKYQVVNYGSLVKRPANSIRRLCAIAKIPYDDTLLVPTIAGRPWGGNSSFGRLSSEISNNTLNNYKQALSVNDISRITETSKRLNLELDDLHLAADVLEKWQLIDQFVTTECGKLKSQKTSREYFNSLHNIMSSLQN